MIEIVALDPSAGIEAVAQLVTVKPTGLAVHVPLREGGETAVPL